MRGPYPPDGSGTILPMPDEPETDTPRPATSHRFMRGVRLGMPIFLGYVPVGAAFGMLARTSGFSVIQSVACSGLVLAGAGQFVGLTVMQTGDMMALLVATAVINLRYVLFGAALSPHMRTSPLRSQAALAFSLTDETFAVNIADHQEGRADDASMAGVGAIAWAGWVGGTAAGAILGSLVGDPARWGVGFAMPAMFTALLVAQATERRFVAIGALAAGLALLFALVLPGTWFIVAASMTAATVGAVAYR
jgi:4-azaleucine resistance transporter AzlC